MCMSAEENRRQAFELVGALLKSAPAYLTSEKGRWIWATGKLAAMVVRWARMDMSVRQEVRGIIESSKRRE